MVYYYKCMRFLLHSVILSADLADARFLRKCAEACGGVCQTYKKLHQTVPVGFSVMALHSVFLAGRFRSSLHPKLVPWLTPLRRTNITLLHVGVTQGNFQHRHQQRHEFM